MADDTHIDLEQTVTALRQQLEARTAERDAGLAREAALAEVLQTTNSSPGDLTPVFDAILEKAHALCGVEHGALVTYDGEYFRMAADRGMPQFWVKQFRQPYRGSSLHERLLCGERYVQVADARAAAETLQSRLTIRAGTRTILMVPLRKEGALRGFITAHRREVRLFSDKEIALLENFAAQAVIAIENARLLTELQARTRDLEESLEYQTATSDVLNVISRSTADVQPMMDTVIETAARLCSADVATISLREGEVYRYMSSSTAKTDPELWAVYRQRTVVPGRDSVAGRVLLEGRVVHVADIRADPDYASPENVAAGRRTLLGVPLLRDSEPIGIIVLARHRVEPFTERQIGLVRTFADQAVIAMENARLLGELQARTRDLEESLEYQTATSDVLNVISRSTSNVQPVLDTVAETAARLCGADSVTIWTREGEVYRAASSSYITAEPELWAAMSQRTMTPSRDSLGARTALEGRVVHIEDRAADPDYAWAESVASGRRTGLGVPLLRDGEPIGVIALSRKRVEPFTERQIELVRTFSDQAVIAMENARLLTELRESLEYQTATSDVLKVISRSTADVQPVLDTVTETAVRLCGADSGSMLIREGEVYRYVTSSDPVLWPVVRHRTVVPGRGSIAARVALEGSVVHVEDILADPEYTYPEALRPGRRSFLGVPLLRDSKPIGVISLSRRRVE